MPGQNTNIETNQLIEKFIKDRNESFADGKSISHHVNGMFQSVKNTEMFAVNEPSNLKCIQFPYKYLGNVELIGEQKHLIFSGDEVNSEIGIVDILNCIYTKLVNNKCLAFSQYNNPIKGFLRINELQEQEVIFVDGGNPDRIINLTKLPFKYKINEDATCKTKEYTNELDCDALLLNPKISLPSLSVEGSTNGNLPDGVYFVSVAYVINGLRFSDYYDQSLPVQINSKSSYTSLEVTLSNLDRSFDKYQLLLTGTVKGVTTHKIIGVFSTSQTSVFITDWVNDEYQEGIPSTELTSARTTYDSTGILSANSQYLFRSDVKQKAKLNYQPQAFNIKANYIVKQVPLKYYKESGDDIGYFRDENYNPVIRWYYTDGSSTEHYQIAGPKPNGFDLSIATGEDVFETDANEKDCDVKEKVHNWEVYNTAGNMVPIASEFKCNERIIGKGKTGYWASSNNYPDNPEIFGINACTPIRYHKMPDEQKVPRYQVIADEIYINIIGLEFENIEHPKDTNGNYIETISHYEILRSERDIPNSTIISRGIVTNMGEYSTQQNRKVLYNNFPFNSTLPNSYLSKKEPYQRGGRIVDFQPLDVFHSDKLSYYTPFGSYFGRKQVAGYLQFETEET